MIISRRMKKSTRQYIMVALISLSVIGGAAIITSVIITDHIREEYKALLNEANKEIEANKKNIYIATENIIAGEAIVREKLDRKTVFASQPGEIYMSEEDLDKLALINIPAGTQILKQMLTTNAVAADIREMQYDVIQINSNIMNYDAVDIRISFQDGEDFTVVSKKRMKGYEIDGTTCYLWMSEEEIIRMNCAIVDAASYAGAYLYTAKYIEPNLQEATIVTYIPSLSAIHLIRNNPNIIDSAINELSERVRKALENRLAENIKKDVKNQHWNIGNNFIYQQNNKSFSYSEEIPIDNTDTANVPIENTHQNTQEDKQSKGADLGINKNDNDQEKQQEYRYLSLEEG